VVAVVNVVVAVSVLFSVVVFVTVPLTANEANRLAEISTPAMIIATAIMV